MLTFDVKRKINTLRDILVGKVPDPKAQVEQITIALIYKFMDDMDIEGLEFGGTRQFFTGEYEKYAWTEIMKPENSGQQRALLYAEGIEKMTTNPNLPQLFRDIFRGAYIPYRDPDTLNMFLKEVSDFSYDNSEDLGNAFEYLLSIMGSQGDAGQFRTPRHIIDMMVEIVDPKKNETILDPACGTAGFLISAYRHILAQNKDEDGKSTLTADDRKRLTENFAGYDISPDMVRLSRVNMYLHHFTKPKISEYDTLTSEEKWDDCYDVILANPPFMTPKGGIMPHSRYRVKAKRSEVLFVDYIAEHLNPTGRAAIIVPEGIVFQSANAYKELRKYLVDDGLLYAVISLPAGVFNPYSGVKTSILLIDKSFARLKDEILFVKLNNDGFDLGAQRREIEGSEIPEIIRIVQKYHADFEPQTADDDILHHPLVTITSKKKIASQDYILVGERYRESNNIISKWPLVSIGEVCELRVGGTPSKQQEEYWSNGTIKWISSKYISDDGKITNYQLITEQALRDSSTKIAPKDSVILITRVSVGKFAYTTTEYAINQDLTCLIPGRGLNPKFLYYMARSLALQIAQNAQGIGVKGVTQKYVSEMKIPFPPLMVQEEIVAELDSHQKIIDGARQVVENYKPTIQNNSHWETVRLGDICELNPRKSEVKDFEGNVSFVPMAMVSETDMYFSVQEQKPLKEVYTGYTYFRDDDVLLAKVTPCFENGKSGLAKNLENGIGFGSSEFFVLRANPEKVLPEYIYYIINSNRFIAEGTPQMTGTGGLRRLTKDFVLNYPVSLPPLDVQRRIVNQTEEEITIVEQNKRLIEIFEKKINDKISEVWGE
ncbi:MAG: N-6 DNA methylase [Negativibacillus massiliensis]|uniref:N-6 DNA methylase n=1 Tax=Negativibacillus massiliensis TaxID=1871035 RepID=UPI0039A0ED2B